MALALSPIRPGASAPGFFVACGGVSRRSRGALRVVLALLQLLLGATAVPALEVGGLARIFWTNAESAGFSTRNLEQRLQLGLRQEISPYLTLALDHSHLELTNRPGDGQETSRRRLQPQLNLLYSRRDFNANLGYSYRRTDGSFDSENFEARGITAGFFWRALSYLSLDGSFSDEVNQTDVAALGRDTETRTYRGSVRLDQPHWNSGYDYSYSELENRSTGLRSDQSRHELRLGSSGSFLGDRLTVSAQGRLGRLETDQEVPEGARLAEPVPAVRGLFAIELDPTVGELGPSPGLIDGDFETPVSPPIEIGGAATFRNIGLDLGLIRPITRLEIAVDQPSGANLGWEVYRSRDNLLWEPVPGVLSEWDPALLRYTLRFPETEDRFFKAVNVTTNPASQVLVTELRALRELTPAAGAGDTRSDLYSVDISAGYRFSERARLIAGFGSRADESTLAGLVGQDRQVDYRNLGFSFDAARSVQVGLSYAWNDSEDRRDPDLDRTTEAAGVSLRWSPLPTVGIVLSTGTYDEYRRTTLLQRSRSSQLGIRLQLLRDLRLNSDLRYSRLDDPFSGLDRNSWAWSLGLQAQLRPNWSLRGGYSDRVTESTDGALLLETSSYDLRTAWSPGAFLSLIGEWRLSTSNFADSLRQTYGLTYSPGPKLSMTASWLQLDSEGGRTTENGSATLSYRLYRRVLVWASLSRSQSRDDGGIRTDINSAQLGLTIEF